MDELITTTLATIASQYLGTESPKNVYEAVYDDPKADEISGFSRPLLTFAAVTTIIIMLVGIFGNILTTVALLKCPKVRNVAAAFIISLCIADCIFCAVVLPFSAFRYIQGTWTHGDFLCKLIPFIQYGNIGVSLLCIAMITINRYIMIAHHNSYARIYKRHWIGAMIIFCWVFSYGMQLPTLFGVWGEFGYDKKLGTCSILRDQFGRSSKTALFAIAFVTPCIIIITCYARIFWVVHESEVRLRKHAQTQNKIQNNLRTIPSTTNDNNNESNRVSTISQQQQQQQPQISNSSSFETNHEMSGTTAVIKNQVGGGSQKSMRIRDQRDAKAKRNEWRITKMVLAIFLSFIACYLPITIVKVIDQNVAMPGFHIFAYIMLYLSACINPIIYVIMNKQYRQAYKTVLMCKPSRLLPFTNAGSSAGEKWKDVGYSYNHSRTMVSQVSLADQNNLTNINQNQPVIMELTSNSVNPLKSHLEQINNNNNNNLPSISNSNTNNNSMTQNIQQPSLANITNNNRRMWLMNSGNNNDTKNIFQNFSTNSNNSTVNNPLWNNTTNKLPSQTTKEYQQKTWQQPTTTIPIYHPLNRSPSSQEPISAQLELPPQQLRQFIQHQDFQRPGMRITLDEGDIIVEEEEDPPQISAISSSHPLTKTEEVKETMNLPTQLQTIQPVAITTATTSTIQEPIFIATEPMHKALSLPLVQQRLVTSVDENSIILKNSNDIPDNNTKVLNSNVKNDMIVP